MTFKIHSFGGASPFSYSSISGIISNQSNCGDTPLYPDLGLDAVINPILSPQGGTQVSGSFLNTALEIIGTSYYSGTSVQDPFIYILDDILENDSNSKSIYFDLYNSIGSEVDVVLQDSTTNNTNVIEVDFTDSPGCWKNVNVPISISDLKIIVIDAKNSGAEIRITNLIEYPTY